MMTLGTAPGVGSGWQERTSGWRDHCLRLIFAVLDCNALLNAMLTVPSYKAVGCCWPFAKIDRLSTCPILSLILGPTWEQPTARPTLQIGQPQKPGWPGDFSPSL
jgi:hypothetical protein